MAYLIEILFWSSIFAILYCYLIYPFTLVVLGLLFRKKSTKPNFTPSVTIIIAAYNEEKVIRKNLLNKLALEYPKSKLEIIVVSDASDDGTDKIVEEFSTDGVKLIRQKERSGKTAGLNRAVIHAYGEVICFSDANSIWDKNTLLHLARNFADMSIGYVTGKMVYTTPEGNIVGSGCSAYMKYENWLRSIETNVGSVVGVDGGIDAIRKTLYEPINPALIPDFILPLKVVEKGFRVIYEPNALLKEESLGNSSDEFKMRKRVILRSLHALKHMKHLFNPISYGLFSYQLFVHKLLRYFVWTFMLTAICSNLLLLNSGGIYKLCLLLQVLLYLLAIIGAASESRGKKTSMLTFVPYYFSILNLSCALAFFSFIRGKNTVVWEPRKG